MSPFLRSRFLPLSATMVLLAGLVPGFVSAAGTASAAATTAPAATAEPGKPAPDFALKDLAGNTVKLSEQKGKVVVLEWFNPECPFVRHAHTKGDLKDMGNARSAAGIVWLAINSGAPGMQGAGAEKNATLAKEYGMKYPVLLDESGEVGRRYGAKTTPHMFVIDPQGVLVYRGAIDNAPLGEAEGAPVNHVAETLAALVEGKLPRVAETRSYGCSVKYGK